jgi:hypothetical protein
MFQKKTISIDKQKQGLLVSTLHLNLKDTKSTGRTEKSKLPLISTELKLSFIDPRLKIHQEEVSL